MKTKLDGHVWVLSSHVANKIAAGEVVERPASVVKELVENAIDAEAKHIRISIAQGGRKSIVIADDGCGMTREDATLSLERQATSKILDVDDIENIDTLGFRGEAIPSIASVSRFSITTRRHDSDEGTVIKVDAGSISEISAAGCPPGTIVEVKELFCNVPARRKFLRSAATEEIHIKNIFTVHALAHHDIGFTLTVDGRELYNLAPSPDLKSRITELFGGELFSNLSPVEAFDAGSGIKVYGYLERPNLSTPTRRDQYIFINSRPASAPSIAYQLKESYPRLSRDTRPAAVLFVEVSPSQVDVNVHPTKKEVRFRDNNAVKRAIAAAVDSALGLKPVQESPDSGFHSPGASPLSEPQEAYDSHEAYSPPVFETRKIKPSPETPAELPIAVGEVKEDSYPKPVPVPMEFAVEPDSPSSKPWAWFKFLAQTDSGYILIETDAGLVTVNPYAARERIAFERLMKKHGEIAVQRLLIPETVQFTPPEFARISASLAEIEGMGFSIEKFGHDTFKVDAVPQLTLNLSPSAILSTISRDLGETQSRRAGEKWREELIAKSIARSFAGSSVAMNEKTAVKLVEELCSCRMPYVCPRGKPVMIFTSTRELNRKFERD